MGVCLTGSKKQSVTQKPSSMSEPSKARQAQKYSSFTQQMLSCVSDSGRRGLPMLLCSTSAGDRGTGAGVALRERYKRLPRV